MRNLKRALSLTLASVMLLGMMVIGTSAASYPDVTDEHNVEAIEVLQAVGVMSGSDSGNFNPDSQVSRIEMAIVMSNLLNLKVDYFEGQCKFTDVPAWAGKYVAACEAEGIVSGVGGGRFGTGNVTATQAALMMLKALGYFQYASDFEGGWDRNTARLASDLLLFKGMENEVHNDTVLTRNQVAQLALNTLKADVVVAEKNQSDISVSVGDAVVDITGKVNYVVTASSEPYAYAIDSVRRADSDTLNGVQGCIIQLGEKLYNGKLKLDDNATDEFNRPARYWEYDGRKMQAYVKTDLLKAEWHEKVTGRMLFDTLGSSLVNNIKNNKLNSSFQYSLETYVDGFVADKSVKADADYLGGACFNIDDITRTNTDKVGATGNGALTQVFIDTENTNGDTHQTVTVTVINTYLARADKDYDAKKDEVDLKVYNIDDKIDGTGNSKKAYVKTHTRGTNDSEFATEIIKVTGADFEIENIKADDNYLVTVARDEIITMEAPEVVSEVGLNSFKKGDWAKNDDVQYDYATTAQYDDEVLDIYDNINMKDVTYNIILDKYGYLIGIEVNEAVTQYLFLTGIDLGSSNLSKKNADANVIFTDGTMKTVTVNTDKSELASNPKVDSVTKPYTITGGGDSLEKWGLSNYAMANNWFTYTVDDNGIYTLKQVGNYSAARTDGVRGAKKIAQSTMDASTFTKSQFDVNGKNRSMDGSKTSTNLNGDFTKVYGNSESVYINVKTTTINNKNGTVSMIVDKVDSCTTGIDNVDFTVKDIPLTDGSGNPTGAPVYETYVLYNSDGYVIAAVSMNPDDNGTSAKYAYVTSGIKQEDYLGGNTWRWGVDAIIDGEIVRLTEVNDSQEYIKDNMAGNWYDVRFDKDGNVSSIKPTDSTVTVKPSAVDFDLYTGDKFITNVHNVARATNGVSDSRGGNVVTDDAGIYHNEKFENFTEKLSSLLLFQNFTCSTHSSSGTPSKVGVANLSYDHFTLYTDTKATAGLGISPTTKIVVCLSEKHNGGAFDTVTAEFTGDQGMKDALKLLNSEKDSFDGWLGAVIKDGIATSIILDDRSGDKDKQTDTNTNQGGNNPPASATIDIKGAGGISALDIYKGGRTQLTEGNDAEVSNILGGVTAEIETETSYTVVLGNPNPGKAWKVTGDSNVAVEGLDEDNLVGANNQFTFKASKTGAIITVEQVDSSKTPATEGEQPIDNARAAIDGAADDAATGNVKVVWWESNSRAVGSDTNGKPTLDEAIDVIRYHLTEELGYKIKTETLSKTATTSEWVCTTQGGITVGTYTFTHIDILEGYRYTDADNGYEIIAKATADAGGVVVANGKYAVYTVNGGTPTWTAKSTGSVKVPVNGTDSVEITYYDGYYTIDGTKTGMNMSGAAFPTIGSLNFKGTGTGFEKTTSGTATYEAYDSTNSTALADEDVLKSGYVKLVDSATDTLKVGGTAISTSMAVKVGQDITVTGVTAGKSVRVIAGTGANATKVMDFTAPATGTTDFTIDGAGVTNDLTVADLTALTITETLNSLDVDVKYTFNGQEYDEAGMEAIPTAPGEKVTVTITVGDTGYTADASASKITVTGGTAAKVRFSTYDEALVSSISGMGTNSSILTFTGGATVKSTTIVVEVEIGSVATLGVTVANS